MLASTAVKAADFPADFTALDHFILGEPMDGSEIDLDPEHGISSDTTGNTPEHRC